MRCLLRPMNSQCELIYWTKNTDCFANVVRVDQGLLQAIGHHLVLVTDAIEHLLIWVMLPQDDCLDVMLLQQVKPKNARNNALTTGPVMLLTKLGINGDKAQIALVYRHIASVEVDISKLIAPADRPTVCRRTTIRSKGWLRR